MDYFHRQLQLWSKEQQDSLLNKKIVIIGSGGLGCSVGLALSGLGIGEMYLVDFDKVEPHNIHRQIAFKISDEKQYKSEVLAKLITDRSFVTKATPFIKNFAEFSALNLEVDIIIDSTDNLETRQEIDTYAKSKNIPWIYGSVEAFRGQVALFEQAKFEDVFKVAKLDPVGIAAPMVMHIASLQANLVTRYFVGLPVQKDKLHYVHFNEDGEYCLNKYSLL